MRNADLDNSKLQKDLLALVAEEAMIEGDGLQPAARLEDLDIASADFVMILMAIEEKYDVYISVDNEISSMESVQDLLDLASDKIINGDRA